jgi:hypothetical protein
MRTDNNNNNRVSLSARQKNLVIVLSMSIVITLRAVVSFTTTDHSSQPSTIQLGGNGTKILMLATCLSLMSTTPPLPLSLHLPPLLTPTCTPSPSARLLALPLFSPSCRQRVVPNLLLAEWLTICCGMWVES